MRTFVLVIFTAFVLAMGYLAYWWMQPPERVRIRSAEKTSAPLKLQKREADKPFGPGKGVWYTKFDPDTAKPVSRFRGEEYTPRNDGWVTVKKPRAQFFMRDGRAISIEGDTGEIVMDDQANKQGMKAFSGSREAPSRGRLHNVTVKLYQQLDTPDMQLEENPPEGVSRPSPVLTVTLPNAAFDNQTFKIYSEGYTERKGRVRIEPDQVPVQLRGEDYDFDGRGLVIRWNDRDRRLQYLEVAHGEKLVIKHPGEVMKRQDNAVALDDVPFALPIMLAAKGREATAGAVRIAQTQPSTRPSTRRSRAALPRPRVKPNSDPPLYRAIFRDNVHITQGADLLVTSEKMSIDFLMQDQSEDKPAAITSPTTQPATRNSATTAPAKKRSRAAATMPSTTQASRRNRAHGAATAPAAEETPIVITWTGSLVVEPLATGPDSPLKEGDAIVRLDGAPVTATQQGSTITCGILTYRTEDQLMQLLPQGPAKPVVMKDTKGSLVNTARMEYSQPKRQAILHGASNAIFPQESSGGQPAKPMLAKWTKTCTLYFAEQPHGVSTGELNIERAELDGDVDVDHPQLKLRSKALELDFNTARTSPATRPASRPVTHPTMLAAATGPSTRPASTRPAFRSDVRQIVATGDVRCIMTDSSKKTQTIDCNRLTMLTAVDSAGRSYPSTVNADGQVHAVDPDQDLRAGHLAVTLRPATQPSRSGGDGLAAELQSLMAHNNVKVIGKDGTIAMSDQLLVDNKDGKNIVKLLGQPQATVIDKSNTLTGPIIEIYPDAQRLDVIGAGTMKGTQQEKADQAPKPIDVTWTRGLSADGKTNIVDVTGQVVAITKESDGAVNTAKGQRVRMLLADAAPSTRPTTRASATSPTSRPGKIAGTQPTSRPSAYGAMASKAIKQVTFYDDAEVSTVSLADDGSLLRRIHLLSPTIGYELIVKKLTIPTPGRMIVEDHRPKTKAADPNKPDDNRGTTAFQWTKSFTYDDATRLAVMEGDNKDQVIIVHRDDTNAQRQFRLTGNTVTAELEEAPAASATKPAQRTAAEPADQTRMQVRRVTAVGNLYFIGTGAEVTSHEMEYDPRTHILTARGDGRTPVVFNIASTQGGRTEAEAIQYNTETGMLLNAVRPNLRLPR